MRKDLQFKEERAFRKSHDSPPTRTEIKQEKEASKDGERSTSQNTDPHSYSNQTYEKQEAPST